MSQKRYRSFPHPKRESRATDTSDAPELSELRLHEIRAVSAGRKNGLVGVLTAELKSRCAGELAGADGVTPGRVGCSANMYSVASLTLASYRSTEIDIA